MPWVVVVALGGCGCLGRLWLPWVVVVALGGCGCLGRLWLSLGLGSTFCDFMVRRKVKCA